MNKTNYCDIQDNCKLLSQMQTQYEKVVAQNKSLQTELNNLKKIQNEALQEPLNLREVLLMNCVEGETVCKEVVETLTCKKHGCLQVHVKRFGRFRNKFKCLEVEKLRGDEAAQFLINTEKIRERLPQAIPFKFISVSKTIPPCYGKTLSPYTQRARYINEQDWGFGSEVLFSECKVYKVGT